MKGVLNYQFRAAFIATLQKTCRDERFVGKFYRELASKEQDIARSTLLTWLAKQADQKRIYCALLLHRLGAVIPVDDRSAGDKSLYGFDSRKGAIHFVRKLERLERSDFGKLIALCNAQKRWV